MHEHRSQNGEVLVVRADHAPDAVPQRDPSPGRQGAQQHAGGEPEMADRSREGGRGTHALHHDPGQDVQQDDPDGHDRGQHRRVLVLEGKHGQKGTGNPCIAKAVRGCRFGVFSGHRDCY